jgi:hypothetical protein
MPEGRFQPELDLKRKPGSIAITGRVDVQYSHPSFFARNRLAIPSTETPNFGGMRVAMQSSAVSSAASQTE